MCSGFSMLSCVFSHKREVTPKPAEEFRYRRYVSESLGRRRWKKRDRSLYSLIPYRRSGGGGLLLGTVKTGGKEPVWISIPEGSRSPDGHGKRLKVLLPFRRPPLMSRTDETKYKLMWVSREENDNRLDSTVRGKRDLQVQPCKRIWTQESSFWKKTKGL